MANLQFFIFEIDVLLKVLNVLYVVLFIFPNLFVIQLKKDIEVCILQLLKTYKYATDSYFTTHRWLFWRFNFDFLFHRKR